MKKKALRKVVYYKTVERIRDYSHVQTMVVRDTRVKVGAHPEKQSYFRRKRCLSRLQLNKGKKQKNKVFKESSLTQKSGANNQGQG